MKSPFPGMDPFLERHWGDVHHRLVQYACDALQLKLPADLRARVEERVYLETGAGLSRRVVPDLHLARVGASTPPGMELREGEETGVAEPEVFEVLAEELTEGFVEIREGGGGKVITVIEFQSPANKLSGAGQQKYLEKQDQILRSDASLVEIDLVRAGARVLALPGNDIPPLHRGEYLACISPGWQRRRRELYAMPLRQRLPVLPIPLRQADQRIPLDLQALIDQAYANGRYGDLDYRTKLDPPLPSEDRAWANHILRTKAAR